MACGSSSSAATGGAASVGRATLKVLGAPRRPASRRPTWRPSSSVRSIARSSSWTTASTSSTSAPSSRRPSCGANLRSLSWRRVANSSAWPGRSPGGCRRSRHRRSGEPLAVEALSQYDAVTLFVDRARRARPSFSVDDTNAAAVAQVCHRLDGIPLAVELAAARCRHMSVDRIASELDDRFHLLTGGSRTVMPRQQTLAASVEWSFDLLDELERRVLRRLGAFEGPFALEAAEAVVAAPADVDPIEVFDTVSRLVDKSLVIVEDAEGGSRYRLLETIRAFAVNHAREAGELALLRDTHALWWSSPTGGAARHRPDGRRHRTGRRQPRGSRRRADLGRRARRRAGSAPLVAACPRVPGNRTGGRSDAGHRHPARTGRRAAIPRGVGPSGRVGRDPGLELPRPAGVRRAADPLRGGRAGHR